jgi:hypothetical protein
VADPLLPAPVTLQRDRTYDFERLEIVARSSAQDLDDEVSRRGEVARSVHHGIRKRTVDRRRVEEAAVAKRGAVQSALHEPRVGEIGPVEICLVEGAIAKRRLGKSAARKFARRNETCSKNAPRASVPPRFAATAFAHRISAPTR